MDHYTTANFHDFQVLQAIVGTKRLDGLDRSVRNKLSQLTNSGKHEALHMFKIFDKDGQEIVT